MRYTALILTILLSAQINLTYAQEPNSNERKTKALIQMMSAFSIKMALDEDAVCKEKQYKDFSIDEIVNLMPETSLGKGATRESLAASILKLKEALTTKLPDGRSVYKGVYEQAITAFKAGDYLPSTKDGHCDYLYQAATNIMQNAKNNLQLSGK